MSVRHRRYRLGERNLGAYVFLITAVILSAAPLLLVILNSLRTNSEIITDPLAWPSTMNVENYRRAWLDASLGTYMVNSLLVTAGALTLCLLVSLPIAYALGRWSFSGKGLVAGFLLAGLMVPIRIGALPLYHLYESVRLMDTLQGLVLIYAASGMPMAVLILTAFYRGLPDSLADAARVDGAGEGTIFWRILTPLVRPAIVTVLVLNVGPAWNDFFYPLILQRTEARFTLPVGISMFFSEYSVDRGMLFAGLVIAAAPLAVLFALCMRQVVAGLTAGMER